MLCNLDVVSDGGHEGRFTVAISGCFSTGYAVYNFNGVRSTMRVAVDSWIKIVHVIPFRSFIKSKLRKNILF